MHGRVEAVRALREAEVAQDAVEELLLRCDREVALEEGVVSGLTRLAHVAVSSGRSTSKSAFTSAVFIPGSYWSRKTS